MDHISSKTLQFLKELKQNNYREWFNENKHRFEEAKSEFEAFIEGLIKSISDFDKSIGSLNAKKAIFRIYRDTRFSKDKSPYKTNIGAHLVAHASKVHDRAGYYIHIEPGNCFLAGGAYVPPSPWLNVIREQIAQHGDEFRKIINHPDFKKYFGSIEGEKLKTNPKGFPNDHPEIELLRFKSFLAVHQLKDKQVTGPGFLEYAGQIFKAIHPFDSFLNRGLA